MSNRRLEFHDILVQLLGSANVYFQPPATVKMHYPCIVYERNSINAKYADDLLYNNRVCYAVTVIDSNPDSEISFKVGKLPLSSFERHFTANNLNHDIYNVYY
jgi:hypothetical protein